MARVTNPSKRLQCPTCRQLAKRVTPVTLRALLKDEYINGITVEGASHGDSIGVSGGNPDAGDTDWRFCASPDCDVVYFSEQGTFAKSQLKVPVGVKEASGERPLCYCFGHSVASIKNELGVKGRSDALDDIRAKMKNSGCHCECANPSGTCCLSDVTNGIETALMELGIGALNIELRPTPAQRPVNRGEFIAKLGTLLSAIMASACCWLPLVLLAIGVSGAGIASTLEVYRPLFIVVTVGCLGAAFYFTYRPREVDPDHGSCALESGAADHCCSSDGQRNLGMMPFNKAMLWVVTALAVAFLFFPSYVGALLGTNNRAVENENMTRTRFHIDGMTCEGCASTVAEAIRGVPRVQAVTVSYETQEAVVGTEPSQSVPLEQILAALKRAGYTGNIITE